MKQYFFGLLLVACSINTIPLYADALDELVEQKEAEQKKEQVQQKTNEQNKIQKQDNITDCEQSVEKALEKRKAIEEKMGNYLPVFTDKAVVDSEGSVFWSQIPHVCGFAKKGVFICYDMNKYYKFGIYDYFIYTKNTDYATGDLFKETSVIYKDAGYYKYEINGKTSSVRAFKATSYKVPDIMPKTYLENKELMCCQCRDPKANAFKEVGFIEDKNKSRVEKYDYGNACRTKKHPKGFGFLSDGSSNYDCGYGMRPVIYY